MMVPNHSQVRNTKPLPMIHSTFHDVLGDVLTPHGLEWGMSGQSHVLFVVPESDDSTDVTSLLDLADFRRDIVQAYNRWCFAKDLPFRTVEDIASIEREGLRHLKVEWSNDKNDVERVIKHENVEALLRNDSAKQNVTHCSPAEVWVNGVLVGILDGPDTVENLVAAIPKDTPNKLCYKRSDGRIRIDRYYRGGLRKTQAWDHVFDCLVALEDPVILDDRTLIGTATLRDWIMGGNLTSRLWVRDLGDSILFQRPLYKDDLNTSDRRYEISMMKEPEKVAKARIEIARLRQLATMEHPCNSKTATNGGDDNVQAVKDPLAEIRDKLGSNRKRGKFFGF